MKTILLAAFEPFGLIIRAAVGLARGEGVLRHNAGLDVANLLKAGHSPDLLFEVLPVSGKSETCFAVLLEKIRPDGVIALGEHLLLPPARVKIEPYAVDTPASALNQWSGGTRVESAFVARTRPSEMDSSTIGRYFCNRVYLAGLRWSTGAGHGAPVVFIHVPVLGDRNAHAAQVAKVIEDLRQKLRP